MLFITVLTLLTTTMILNGKIIYGLSLCCFSYMPAQAAFGYGETTRANRDSAQEVMPDFSCRQLILPVTLMAYGTVEIWAAPKIRLLNYVIGHSISAHTPKKFRVDNVSQYVPALSVYALNLAGIKGKNSFKERTVILGTSALLTAITVNIIKYTVCEERPDKSAFNSFPSGHTAVAFMGAEFLRQEYKEVSVWYGVAGYTVAFITGAFRIYNNRHWVGDVAFGAGIGILCTKTAYWLYPVLRKKFLKNRKQRENITLLPYSNGQQIGFSL
ncbi:MAG: phosphatase PAP2 family protein, partial [Bacteroidales bacterium]|nr:phosphatase PAP2 family protein [Bacteroidales bacterium]